MMRMSGLRIIILFYFIFVAGINKWPGKQMHSHNYRDTKPFQDQVCANFFIFQISTNI